ncbi:MAG: hypothetical protein ABR909_10405 [Candidatus Bathyarchaeia archaeon]
MMTTVLAPILLSKSFEKSQLKKRQQKQRLKIQPLPDYMPTYPL